MQTGNTVSFVQPCACVCIKDRAMPHTSAQPVVELRRNYSASHAETTASLLISLVVINNELQFITAHHGEQKLIVTHEESRQACLVHVDTHCHVKAIRY